MKSDASSKDPGDQSRRLLEQAEMAATRLERLAPDSTWACKASGCRGSLLRLLEQLEMGSSSRAPREPDLQALQQALDQGYSILAAAAREQFKKGPASANPSP